jgi:UDP-glucuronate 4-epimerase
MQPGDVEKTFADTTALERDYGYRAATTLDEGIGAFVEWYRDYYRTAKN